MYYEQCFVGCIFGQKYSIEIQCKPTNKTTSFQSLRALCVYVAAKLFNGFPEYLMIESSYVLWPASPVSRAIFLVFVDGSVKTQDIIQAQ